MPSSERPLILLIEAGPEKPDVTRMPSLPPALRWSSIDRNFQTQPDNLTCRGSVGGQCHWDRGTPWTVRWAPKGERLQDPQAQGLDPPRHEGIADRKLP
ncbi:jg5525 [Pararge aegeria aegeria]|uniref:Jg5525 protein n=1 Tax=Pararge aegeria aegeria TaxID=348720 RepID=A0A8S4SNF0_9NEOP|nr:jg5525 [Pararge aegeria aegeria]